MRLLLKDRRNLFFSLVVLAGISLITFALTADLLGVGGHPGLGPNQLYMALFGLVLLAGGLAKIFNLTWQRLFIEKSDEIKPASLFRSAVFWAILFALIELLIHAYHKIFEGTFIFLSQHLLWMAPLANLFLFAAFSFVLLPFALRRSKLISFRFVTFLFMLFGLWGVLLMFWQLSTLASFGAALLFAILASRIDSWQRIVNRGYLLLGCALVVFCIGTFAWKSWAEKRLAAKLPKASAEKPNVLVIVWDTVRSRSLSLYGYGRDTTPGLQSLANHSLVFDNAIAPASWTLPSHASIFTGRYAHELSVGWGQPLDDTYPTLAEILRDEGYRTAGFVANYNYCGYESGIERGFIRYEDYPVSFGQIILSSTLLAKFVTASWFRDLLGWHATVNRKVAAEVNRQFLSWLDEIQLQPFFAFLNYYDAHQPFLPPSPFDEMFGDIEPRGSFVHVRNMAEVSNWHELSPKQIQAEKNAYDGAIAYLDHQTTALLQNLDRYGVLENTIVVITSDHGEQLGEHNLYSHGNSLYMPLIRVPLVISFPKAPGGGIRIEERVSLRNVPATILNLIDQELKTRLPGYPLTRLADGSQKNSLARSPLLSQTLVLGQQGGYLNSIIVDGYHYIRYGDGREELFDLTCDPDELRNLIGNRKTRPVLTQARATLESALDSLQTQKEHRTALSVF